MSWRWSTVQNLVRKRSFSPLPRSSLAITSKSLPVVGHLPQILHQPLPLIKTNQQISWFSTSNLFRCSSKNDGNDEDNPDIPEKVSIEEIEEDILEHAPETLVKNGEVVSSEVGLADNPGEKYLQ